MMARTLSDSTQQEMAMVLDAPPRVYGDDEVAAARRLQAAWYSNFRWIRARRVAAEYIANGMTSTIAQALGYVLRGAARGLCRYFSPLLHPAAKMHPTERMTPVFPSFNALIMRLRTEPVLRAGAACVPRIYTLCADRVAEDMRATSLDLRRFLAAYMIVFFPGRTFERMGELEQPLFDKAKEMLAAFERIALTLANGEGFAAVPAQAAVAFATLLPEYMRLFQTWKAADEVRLAQRIRLALIALYQARGQINMPDDTRLRAEFETQIARLRAKMHQIGGAAAVAAFDAEYPPDQSIAPDVAHQMTPIVAHNNEALAHELFLNPNFQLRPDGGRGGTEQHPAYRFAVKEFRRIFWDLLSRELAEQPTPCYTKTLNVLAELRDGIVSLADGAEANAIRAAIDMDFIHTRIHDATVGFVWEDCITLGESILRILRRVQAPRRDAETLARWDAIHPRLFSAEATERPALMAEMLEFFLDRLNVMRVDAANARLRLIAPVIAAHGVDYERSKFLEKLEAGEVTLETTEAWLTAAFARERAAGNVLPEDDEERRAIIAQVSGLLEIVADPESLNQATTPATLLLDVFHLCRFKVEMQDLVFRAACYASFAHAAPPPEQLQAFGVFLVTTATDGPEDEEPPRLDMGAVKARLAEILGTEAHPIFRALNGLECPQDPVRRVMGSRIVGALFNRLARGIPIALAAAAPLVPRIEALAAKIDRVAVVNRTVHGVRYAAMVFAPPPGAR